MLSDRNPPTSTLHAKPEATTLNIEEARLADRLQQSIETQGPTLADLQRRGQWTSALIRVDIGRTAQWIQIDHGRLQCTRSMPLLQPCTFSISAEPATWASFWLPLPAPGWHDLMALNKRGAMQFSGDLRVFLANLQWVKDLLSLPRATPDQAAAIGRDQPLLGAQS